jgi:hypothetical protein
MAQDNKSYDSVLIGWADEPKTNDRGEVISWTLKLKDHEIKDILENYVTPKDPNTGHGGNIIIRLFMSKNGKACASVFNPNSDAAKEAYSQRESKPAQERKVNSSKSKPAIDDADDDDDLPF